MDDFYGHFLSGDRFTTDRNDGVGNRAPRWRTKKRPAWFHFNSGDRLFVTLLGSAFIHLAWMYFAGGVDLWWALGLSGLYGLAVFRWV